jgi:Superinfection immunity protein/Uncharacterised protein family UPF0547
MSKGKVALIAVAAFVAVDALAIITGNGDYMGPVIMALVLIPAYFAPTLIAASRDTSNAGGVAVVNVFLGWTCIGWIVALAMAAGGVPSAQRRIPYVSALPASANAATNATKKCPDCAETVLADARVCRYCGFRFAPAPSSGPASTRPAPTQPTNRPAPSPHNPEPPDGRHYPELPPEFKPEVQRPRGWKGFVQDWNSVPTWQDQPEQKGKAQDD